METKDIWVLIALLSAGALSLSIHMCAIYRLNNAKWENLCFEAWQQTDFDKAQPLLAAAIAIAETFGPYDLRLAVTLYDAALLHHERGLESEAKKFQRRTSGIYYKYLTQWWLPRFHFPARKALAKLYLRQFNTAPEGQPRRPDIVGSLEAAAKSDEICEDVLHFRNAWKIRQRALGTIHTLVAESIEAYVDCYSYGSPNPRDRHLRLAIAIREKAQGPFHPDIAYTLRKLGDRKRSLEILEHAFGPDHLELVPDLNALACKARTTFWYEDPVRFLSENSQSEWLEDHRLDGHPDPGREWKEEISRRTKSASAAYARGERYYLKALEICEKSLGQEHIDVAKQLVFLADFYTSTKGLYSQAAPLFTRSIAIREATVDPMHVDNAYACYRLACTCDAMGRPKSAELYFRRALEIYESCQYSFQDGTEKSALKYRHNENDGNYFVEIVSTLEYLAALLIADNRTAEAKQFLSEAWTIRRQVWSETEPSVGDGIYDSVDYEDENGGNDDEILRLLPKVLAVQELTLGSEHWRVEETRDEIERVLEKQVPRNETDLAGGLVDGNPKRK